MTTPVLQSLHDNCPDATIDIVADSRSDVLYTHCPYKGKTYLKDKKRFLRGSWELLSKARRKYYDLIVDVRTDGLAYLFRGRKRLTKWKAKPYGKHAVENLMGVIREIHNDRRIPDTTVWTTALEERFADSVLAPLPEGAWLTAVPGNINTRKLWPVEKYIELIKAFRGRFSGVILEGSPQERNYTDSIAAAIDLPAVNLAGASNLLQAAAVIRRSTVFIGSDSGLGHIAGAVSTPSLILFSVDSPERVLPWRSRAEYLISEDGHASSIRTETAIEKLGQVLDRTSSV